MKTPQILIAILSCTLLFQQAGFGFCEPPQNPPCPPTPSSWPQNPDCFSYPDIAFQKTGNCLPKIILQDTGMWYITSCVTTDGTPGWVGLPIYNQTTTTQWYTYYEVIYTDMPGKCEKCPWTGSRGWTTGQVYTSPQINGCIDGTAATTYPCNPGGLPA